jgi:hypothetical protein
MRASVPLCTSSWPMWCVISRNNISILHKSWKIVEKSPISPTVFATVFQVSRSQTSRKCSKYVCFQVRERIFQLVQPLLHSRQSFLLFFGQKFMNIAQNVEIRWFWDFVLPQSRDPFSFNLSTLFKRSGLFFMNLVSMPTLYHLSTVFEIILKNCKIFAENIVPAKSQ